MSNKLFAIAFPVLPGKTEKFEKFSKELNTTRKAEFDASRKKLGVRERTFLQHTPKGDFVVVTLEGENPEAAFAKFGQGNDDFTNWFKKEVSAINGLDLNSPPAGPLPELVIDSGYVHEHAGA